MCSLSVVGCSLTYPVTEGRWGADDHLAISYSCVSVVRCSLTSRDRRSLGGDDHLAICYSCVSALQPHISRDRRSLGADDHLAISYSCVSVVRCSLTYPVTRWGPKVVGGAAASPIP